MNILTNPACSICHTPVTFMKAFKSKRKSKIVFCSDRCKEVFRNSVIDSKEMDKYKTEKPSLVRNASSINLPSNLRQTPPLVPSPLSIVVSSTMVISNAFLSGRPIYDDLVMNETMETVKNEH